MTAVVAAAETVDFVFAVADGFDFESAAVGHESTSW